MSKLIGVTQEDRDHCEYLSIEVGLGFDKLTTGYLSTHST